MNQWKTILKRILWPGWGWVLLTVIFGAIALFLAFGTQFRDTPFAYVAYCLSAYGLTVFVAAVVPVLLRIPHFLHRIPLAHRYMTDKYFAVWYGLALSFLINLGFAVLKLVYAVVYSSFWEGGLAIYHILLCVVRLYLLSSFPKGQKRYGYKDELRRYRMTGRLLFSLDAALAIISTLILKLLSRGNVRKKAGPNIQQPAFYK